jgi:protein ImuB
VRLIAIAQQFSPRYQRHGDNAVVVDVSGLERLFGSPRTIAEELRRETAARGARVHVAIAATPVGALVLAHARPGVTVVDSETPIAAALAPLPIGILERISDQVQPQRPLSTPSLQHSKNSAGSAISVFKHWGLKTVGELAALPPADVAARLGRQGIDWQAIARGDDGRPLVPDRAEERFESSMELEWPIEELEPLSFVLTRLLEPLSIRLERRDRGAAVVHVDLRLVTHVIYARRLELPSPIRDVRTLRTLVLLDLESHPPSAAIDGVAIVIDPTPGRVLQHALFARPHPTPEQLSTLLARLGAVMGPDRVGAAATIDSYRPGAFELRPFATEHRVTIDRSARRERRATVSKNAAGSACSAVDRGDSPVVSAVRRCRYPVPARVAVDRDGRPVRVTTDRRAFAGGSVRQAAGPWRSSGDWWAREAGRAGTAGEAGNGGAKEWNRDEWDVALSDGAVYRLFFDRLTDGWFMDAIVD